MKVFKFIVESYKNWIEKKNLKKDTLLSAEIAYTLSAINKETSFDDLYEGYKKHIVNKIKSVSKFGNTEMYTVHPNWVITDHKTKLYQELKELGYNVLYTSEVSMIISWYKQ